MRRSNFALRLQPSLMEEARKAAQAEGVALNQLINVAVAEKVSCVPRTIFLRAQLGRIAKQLSALLLAPGMEMHRCLGTNFHLMFFAKRNQADVRSFTEDRIARASPRISRIACSLIEFFVPAPKAPAPRPVARCGYAHPESD